MMEGGANIYGYPSQGIKLPMMPTAFLPLLAILCNNCLGISGSWKTFSQKPFVHQVIQYYDIYVECNPNEWSSYLDVYECLYCFIKSRLPRPHLIILRISRHVSVAFVFLTMAEYSLKKQILIFLDLKCEKLKLLISFQDCTGWLLSCLKTLFFSVCFPVCFPVCLCFSLCLSVCLSVCLSLSLR